MSSMFDIQYAIRLLLKAPKFTGLTLFVLVGGLSVSLYTFSFLYSLIYKPINVPEGDSALVVSAKMNQQNVSLPAYEFAKARQQLSNFAELGIFNNTQFRLTIEQENKKIPGTYVDENFFQFSRTQARLGRIFQQNEFEPGAEKTAVISHALWQEDFAADDNIAGQTIRINNQPVTIIGVMPEDYYFPNVAKIWLPVSDQLQNPLEYTDASVNVYARIKPGTTKQEATAELETAINNIYQQSVQNFNAEEGDYRIRLMSLPQAEFAGAGGFIFGFLNIVALMILILACINVGNLLLARAVARQKETAIRAAIGATYKRLVLQIMWEGLLITLVGGVLAVMLTGTALHYTNILISTQLPDDVPFWWVWGIDQATILVAILFCLITLFLCSYLPARRAARQDINSTLRDGTRGAQSQKAGKMSRKLITTQVFLISVLMLIGSVTAFVAQYFLIMDMGLNYQSVIGSDFKLPENRYASDDEKMRFFQKMLYNVEAQDNIEAASVVSRLDKQTFAIAGIEYQNENDKPKIDTYVTIGNTDFYGVNLVEGRFFDSRDTTNNRNNALISQSMANRYWPGESALGQSIQWTRNDTRDDTTETLNIIGVVSDRINITSLFSPKDNEDEVYLSGQQFTQSSARIMLKYTTSYIDGERALYDALFATDSNIELDKVAAMEKTLDSVRNILKTISNVTFSAGFFALLLALLGIYGLTANNIFQRRNEIGVRRAVGAKDRQIIKLFVMQGIRQLSIGIGASLLLFGVLAFALNDIIHGAIPMYLYFVLTIAVIFGISLSALTAIYVPAKRTVEQEPSSVLRYE